MEYKPSILVKLLCCIFTVCIDAAAYPSVNNGTPLDTVPADRLILLGDSLRMEGNYDSAINVYKSVINAPGTYNQLHLRADLLLEIADMYLKTRDTESALSNIGSAYDLAAGLPDNRNLMTKVYQYAGPIYLTLKEYDTARVLLDKSLRTGFTGDLEKDTILARTYINLGNYFWYLNQFDSSLYYYEKALELAGLKSRKHNEVLASANQNLGITYARLGYYEKAETHLLSSLRIKEVIFGNRSLSLARTYSNLAIFFNSISKIDSAFKYFRQAEKIYINHFSSDHPELTNLYINLANCHIALADNENALYYLKNALLINKGVNNFNSQIITDINLNLGYVYEKLNDTSSAIKYYFLCLKDDKNPTIIKAYRNLARIFSEQEEYEKSNSYFQRAIDLSRKIFGDYNQDIGLGYQYYGQSLLKQGKTASGVNYLNAALGVFRKIFGEKNRDVAKVIKLIGDHYLENGAVDSALIYYQRSLIASVNGFDSEDPADNPDVAIVNPDIVTFEALISKARALDLMHHRAHGTGENLLMSYRSYQATLQMLNLIRNSFMTEESKLFISEYARKLALEHLRVARQLYQITGDTAYVIKMFSLAEGSKASVLMGALREAEAELMTNIPEQDLNYENMLRRELGFYNEKIETEKRRTDPRQELVDLWTGKAFEIKTSLDKHILKLEEEHPYYYNLKYLDREISIEDIQQNLSPGENLLEYVLLEDEILIFLINAEGIHVEAIETGYDTLNESIRIVRTIIMDNPATGQDEDQFFEFVQRSNYLYRTIILPVRDRLRGNRLGIVPDAELNLLPFDMLISSADSAGNNDYKNLDYLFKDYIVRYAPTSTLMFNDGRKKKNSRKNGVLAFAPEYGPTGTTDPNSIRNGLVPLIHSGEEVNAIMELYRGKKFLSETATEQNFILNSDRYGVIHLAMHTIVDDVNPMYSKLVFSEDSPGGGDGYLNTYELYSMNLSAGLAVLSACNTGSGKLIKGEGVISLARAFLYSGVSSIVMTLWTVDDLEGARLMTYFYQNLREGHTVDIALNKAKVKLLEESSRLKSHPYFWAGYVAIGASEPVDSNILNRWAVIFALTATAALILILLTIFRKTIIKMASRNI